MHKKPKNICEKVAGSSRVESNYSSLTMLKRIFKARSMAWKARDTMMKNE